MHHRPFGKILTIKHDSEKLAPKLRDTPQYAGSQMRCLRTQLVMISITRTTENVRMMTAPVVR
jgi:hypothetical protein